MHHLIQLMVACKTSLRNIFEWYAEMKSDGAKSRLYNGSCKISGFSCPLFQQVVSSVGSALSYNRTTHFNFFVLVFTSNRQL